MEASPPAGLNPDGRLNVGGIEEEINWYQHGGFLPKTITLEGVIDYSFLDRALAALGPYNPPAAARG